MFKKLLFLSFIILFGFAPSICRAKYSGGDGSQEHPYRISNAYDMNDIGLNQEDWGKHFVLTDDIDLAQFTGTQFNIIAPGKLPSFTGVFDGNGFTISNFTYDSSGIFGRVGSYFDPNGEIKNLGLINPNVDGGGGGSLVSSLFGASISNCYAEGGSVSGGSTVGGLVGENREGTILNCYATGNVSATSRYAGGLVGYSKGGSISNSYATGNVSATSRYAGGLVGYKDEGTILDCYATGDVSGNTYIGGLIGQNFWTLISNCYATGRISGDRHTGGLLGWGGGTTSNCYATGAVVGNLFTGGLVGSGGNISNCYATGAVDGNDRTGGLVGWGNNISNCYATGNVNGNYRTGGLVGYNLFGTILDCNAIGNVSGSADETGGLVGYNDGGTIANCFTTGNVDGTSCVGGLIGENESDSKTSNCYTTGNISGTGDYVGGLRGKGSFGIFECYSTGSVSGGNYVGGLAGGPEPRAFYLGYISNCYSTGVVNGNDYTGGLVGLCSTISNSYATGNVNGNDYTGGLAGAFWGVRVGSVSNCYSTGDVNGNDYTGGLAGYGRKVSNCYAAGDVNGNECTGGLVGFGGGRYKKCFWDKDINPDVNGIGNITDPPDVIGETTENMQTLSTFTDAGWDFVGETANGSDDIWKMCYDPDYPHLWWEKCPRPSFEMPMHFTPRMLNPKSKGKWVKAHFILPEGFTAEDVNTNSPAKIVEPFMADSNYMDEDGLVEIEVAFDRAVFCSNGSMLEDIVVIARLTTGQYFYGTDTIRIKTNNLEYLAVLTSYWLEAGCIEPDWCAGADLNRDSVVDFIDFAFFDGCCLEFIQK